MCSAQEMLALYPDRVIAIRGGIDNISQAEAAISLKLTECIENEMQQGMVCLLFINMSVDHCWVGIIITNYIYT